MRTIQLYLSNKQQEISNHFFFQLLRKHNSTEALAQLAPCVTFWAMVFQDILRLNEQSITDRALKRIATHHRIEDANHEKWLLEDLTYLHPGKFFDIPWLFSKEQAKTRDVSYALISEIFSLKEDAFRIILLLTLESAGHVFFENIAVYAERAGINSFLKYFSRYHLDVEKDHELFEQEIEKALYSIELSEMQQQQARALIDRAYVAFDELFALLASTITEEELAVA